MPAHLKMLCSHCCFGFILVILIGKKKSNLFPESWHSHQLFKGSLYATPNQNNRLPWPGSWKKVGVKKLAARGGSSGLSRTNLSGAEELRPWWWFDDHPHLDLCCLGNRTENYKLAYPLKHYIDIFLISVMSVRWQVIKSIITFNFHFRITPTLNVNFTHNVKEMLISMPMLTDQLSRRWTATGNWFRTDQHMRSATFWLQIVNINGQIKFWANLSIVITNVVIIWSYGDMSSWVY